MPGREKGAEVGWGSKGVRGRGRQFLPRECVLDSAVLICEMRTGIALGKLGSTWVEEDVFWGA
jgi:hypothetical protein